MHSTLLCPKCNSETLHSVEGGYKCTVCMEYFSEDDVEDRTDEEEEPNE